MQDNTGMGEERVKPSFVRQLSLNHLLSYLLGSVLEIDGPPNTDKVT